MRGFGKLNGSDTKKMNEEEILDNLHASLLGVDYVDVLVDKTQTNPVRFTFFWNESNRWEGRDYRVTVGQ